MNRCAWEHANANVKMRKTAQNRETCGRTLSDKQDDRGRQPEEDQESQQDNDGADNACDISEGETGGGGGSKNAICSEEGEVQSGLQERVS